MAQAASRVKRMTTAPPWDGKPLQVKHQRFSSTPTAALDEKQDLSFNKERC